MTSPKKTKKVLIVVCLVLAAVLAGGIGALTWYRSAHLTVNDTSYSRDITRLDLSGTPSPELEKLAELPGLQQLNLRDTGISIEEYETVRAALPDCEILWSVPFQGGFFPDDTDEIAITSLTDADVAVLAAYLPGLSKVQADGCTDYAQLMALRAAFPQADVSYSVSVNGLSWPMDTVEMVLTDADAEALSAALPYLPGLKAVTLEGQLPPAETLNALRQAYPGIRFYWQIQLFGQTADVDTTELDLSGISMESVAEVESAVAYLPSLERVYMHHCGISNEEMDALNRRHENIRFIWTVQVGHIQVPTDAITFMPTGNGYFVNDTQCYNRRYCTDMVCVDMGHQPISSCEFVAFMPKLKYLILVDTYVTDISPLANHEELIFLELFLTDITDFSPLLSCTNLEDLNICYTYADVEVISQMTWLNNLWWSPCSTERYEILKARLPDTFLMVNTFSSTDKGWRHLQNYYDHRDLLGLPYADQ